jgi:AraC family L-rhamnose operon regulatory protein RhaS
MTPSQYLTFVRIENASTLLLSSPEKTILDIALENGFSSSQYFASCFKKQKGITPTEYRRRYAPD